MFCQVKVFSKCKDIERVKQSLFLSDRYGDNWLSECQVSLSPCGSVLVFGRQERLSILCTQWDSSSGSTTFVNSWSGTLPGEATALLALPISSCGQSSQVYSDWVCIAVGFRSGDVGFYTEQGQLLLSEKLEDSPVLSIKCYTGRYGNESDELSVVYGKAICRLASSNLLQLLCYARVQLAREQAGGVKEGLDGNTVLTKKFGFNSYNLINDASIVGLDQTNTFDYLANASIHDGFYTRSLRSVAPHNTVVVGVGDPYIGFHHALEGGTAQPLLTEVARAAANKIMGWFGGGRPEPAVNMPPMASDHLLPALELRDPPRRGLQALPSPDRRLLLLHDSLGRLGLMDVRRGTVVRLFKGYRDGQCGFLEVHEKNHKRRGAGPGRRALFLILYIGKRGQLEVWPLRGPRIAAFSAAQHGRLLYSAYGSLQQGNHRTRNAHPSLALIDPDGQIKQLSIPFHFALSNENSDRARDVHLVRRLRLLIKEKECDYDQLKKEVINTVKELKTSDIKIHCIEMMAASRNVPPGILLIYINCLQVAKLDNEASVETTKLKVLVNNLNALVRLFMCVNNIAFDDLNLEETLETKVVLNSSSETQTDDDSQEIPIQESRDLKEEAEPSLITEKELLNFQHLLNLAASAQQKRGIHSKVTFIDDKRSLHSDFLVPFDISADDCYLKIKDSATRESLCFVAQQIFDPCVDGNCDWKSLWKTCSSWKTFIPSDLCKLLFLYWMEKPISDITFLRMESFGKILLDICDIKGFDNIYVGYSDTSPWWQSIRNLLVDAPCPFRSMVTAQICRAVAQKIERDVESNQNSLDDNAWVSLSKDNAQWGLLIGKLDDISLLSIILSQTLEPVNKIPKLLIELPEINLKYIYSSGKGSISELTAKWLCSAGVDPKDIIETSSEGVNKDETKSPPQGLMSFQVDTPKINDISQKDTMSFHAKLNLLKKQFPFSLNTDSLIINMCWEYSKYWVKHMDQLTYLKTMVYCLKSVKQVPMRCGISSLIWSTHLIHSFESAYKLISKVGKLPREKLCQQNIGLSDSQLLKYLEIAYDFFDVFLCSALSSGESQEIVLKFEPIWEESSLALTELTLANSKVNIDVLQVHYQLCAAIYYQSYLGTNYWKHLNYLFDMESQRCAFGPLKTDSHVFVGHQSIDSRVTSQRHQFLGRLVNKCAELPAEQDVWIERVHDLARIWRVDSDHVRRIYVSRLYGQGLDSLAEDALASVTDAQPLLKLLVPLAGRRLRSFMEGITNKGEVLAILPTLTTSYIQSLEEVNNEVTVITSLKPTRNLLEAIIARGGYDSSSPLLKTANMLLDSCTTIQQHLGIGK